MASELYIGLMSGTSLDAVDAVVASFDKGCVLHASHSVMICEELRQKILSVSSNNPVTVSEIGLIDHTLGKLYSAAVLELLEKAQLPAAAITAIGNHGQTVFHQPDAQSPFTIQLGDANLIAALTGIDTVADFRRMDMALGGQGAPLAPAFHQHVFKPSDSTIVVLNLGGIANITVIGTAGQVTGFDTGPGNLLMDVWCKQHTGANYDADALWAKQGSVDDALLGEFLADNYLAKPPPKSTGRELFGAQWFERYDLQALSPSDVQRTLCEFTALSVAQQLQRYKNGQHCEVLVCGGGAKNPLLMQQLQHHLPEWRVAPTSERGIPVDFMEALAFAWLARQHVHQLPGNLPSVTGAKRRIPLGILYSAKGDLYE